ncbi:MAG: hypothetical protein K8S24_07965 [Candidatus Aegiribacteria sp.]|nr:hypothetical protein [Candidatus Aegiribacteria sp.]
MIIDVKLSDKALTYIIDALRFQIDAMEKQLDADTLSENDRADVGNDKRFLEEVVKDLVRYDE